MIPELSEDAFLNKEFEDINIQKLGLDGSISVVIESRINEIKKCMQANAPLSVVVLCGSTLEGILLGTALKYPEKYNKAAAAPRDASKKVKSFPNWTLANFIDVAYEVGMIKEDAKKFSHSLRDFRNYIHPFEQMSFKV